MKARASGGAPVFIVAGEPSGDRHAAELLRALSERVPGIRAGGVGGRHLRAAGQEQLFDLAEHAVVGLTDVLKNYGKFRGFFGRILRELRERPPRVLVLVDFPGFNLRLAKAVRAQMPGIKIVYYISPQVWAWKSRRVRLMERVLDRMLVIFPFEADWYARHAPGLPVSWVGHPLLDRWEPEEMEPLPEGPPYQVALMPGSRRREVDRHWPVLQETAVRLAANVPGTKFLLLAPDLQAREEWLRRLAAPGGTGLEVEVQAGYPMTHLSRCHLALTASGTATLECALAGVPILVMYKVNPLTYAVGRRLVKLPYLSIVNILAGEKIVPEFLQSKADAHVMWRAAERLLREPQAVREMKERLRAVVEGLGGSGASARAAAQVAEFLGTEAVEN